MALSKEDRIAFSLKIVETDVLNAGIDASKQSLLKQKQKALELDEANRRLVDSKTNLINPYQVELGRYNGIFRTELTNQDQVDAGSFTLGNFLYPNDTANPPPSLAPAIWTKTKPYARNKAIGKQYDENYPATVSAEQSKTTTILANIATIETYPLIQRVTGEICTPGSMTPPPFDSIGPNTALLADYNTLLTNINDLRSYVLATQALILTTDTDPTRQAQNAAAASDINNIVSAIDTWLALVAFNNAHGQTTCVGFNTYPPALLGSTRLQSTDLDNLKNALLTRQTFVSTRVSQVDSYLGNIVQDLSTGDYTGTGFYFERWNFVGLRLNIYGGSFLSLKSFDTAANAQDGFKAQNNLTKAAYLQLLDTSLLSAPSNGTDVIHLKDASWVVVGQNVFITAKDQEEITLTVKEVSGNKIKVGQNIPPKYRPAASARVYRDKT